MSRLEQVKLATEIAANSGDSGDACNYIHHHGKSNHGKPKVDLSHLCTDCDSCSLESLVSVIYELEVIENK